MVPALALVVLILAIAFIAGTVKGGVKEGATQVLNIFKYGTILAIVLVLTAVVLSVVEAFSG
jgi:hypothetical protein